MIRKRKLKKKFVVFLYSYALFFVSYFTLTTLARYTTLLNKNHNIPVAVWDVSIAGEDTTTLPPMIIGNSITYPVYNLSVTSKSDVAINYSAIISNVPTGFRIQVDNGTIYSESGNIITIEDLGNFKIGDNSTHNHKLTILFPSEIEPFEQTLDMDVIFTQVEI